MKRAVLLIVLSFVALGMPLSAQDIRSFDFVYRNIDEKPNGLGVPAADRQAWTYVAKSGVLSDAVPKAEQAMSRNYRNPVPDNLYQEFFTNGNRNNYEREMTQRRADLRFLAIAECIEYRGRFLPQIEQLLRSFCASKTWVLPAHDSQQANFNGKRIDIDINSSMIAWEIATVLWLHGSKITPEVQNLVNDNLRRRIFIPFREMMNGQSNPQWWMTTENNWNAICLSGIAGTAMANVPNRKDRAFYVASCIDLSRRYIEGFPKDGYCNEGLWYWVLGFGHYMLFAEMVFENTRGNLNLLKQDSKAWPPALYPDQIRIGENFYPAFADIDFNAGVGDFWLGLRDRLLGRASIWWREVRPQIVRMNLPEVLVATFLPKPSQLNPELKDKKTLPLRSYFDHSGVLVCRPGTDNKSCRLAVAMKAGVNFSSHHHNDIGSFVLGVDNIPIVIDPGREVYTARTFGPRRFESRVINSFGHSVPLIDGVMQHEGKNTISKTLDVKFSATTDKWAIDLRPAYKINGMEALTRTFIYDRSGVGTFSVIDSGNFSRPVAFETAIITLGQWQQVNPTTFQVDYKGRSLWATIVTEEDAPVEISAAPIKEQLPNNLIPLRITVKLKKKTANPVVKIVFSPNAPASENQQ